MGGPVQAARSIAALTVFLGATGGAACSTDSGISPDCKPDPSPTLQINSQAFEAGVVTTAGACSEVRCSAPVGNGCRLWEGEMTSQDTRDHCQIFLELDDGRRMSREVQATPKCGGPQTKRVTF